MDLEPRRILAIDVGGGTQDILLYEAGVPMEASVKLVLPSQTQIVARRIRRATRAGRDILLTGNITIAARPVRAEIATTRSCQLISGCVYV